VYGAGGAESLSSVVPTVSFSFGIISLRWSLALGRCSLALGRADAYQHMVPSWPGAFKVQDGDAPWWCSNTAEAEGKQERSCPLAAEGRFALSDDVCGGLSSARLSTVMALALVEGASAALVAGCSVVRVICS
jgi:hypothetical protein